MLDRLEAARCLCMARLLRLLMGPARLRLWATPDLTTRPLTWLLLMAPPGVILSLRRRPMRLWRAVVERSMRLALLGPGPPMSDERLFERSRRALLVPSGPLGVLDLGIMSFLLDLRACMLDLRDLRNTRDLRAATRGARPRALPRLLRFLRLTTRSRLDGGVMFDILASTLDLLIHSRQLLARTATP